MSAPKRSWSIPESLPVTLCATFIAIAEYRDRKAALRRAQDNPAITCHRRYIRPAADIDAEYRGLWDRAAAAGKRIKAADANFAERLAGDAATVIEQAGEAVRRASEAARILDVPDGAPGETPRSPGAPPPDAGPPGGTP
jgi:hypothetical protein